MKTDLGKTGNAEIMKVGHTYSGSHGSTPMAKVKGVNTTPTAISFGSGQPTSK